MSCRDISEVDDNNCSCREYATIRMLITQRYVHIWGHLPNARVQLLLTDDLQFANRVDTDSELDFHIYRHGPVMELQKPHAFNPVLN